MLPCRNHSTGNLWLQVISYRGQVQFEPTWGMGFAFLSTTGYLMKVSSRLMLGYG